MTSVTKFTVAVNALILVSRIRYSVPLRNDATSTQESDEEDDDEGEEVLIDPGTENILRKFLVRRVFMTSRSSRRHRRVTHDLVAGIDAADDGYDDVDEDPELAHDSIYHLNMSQYLRDFLLNFSTHHCFPMYLQHLNVPELKVLNNININALM